MHIPELSTEAYRRYSLAPFWFWNDRLEEKEIVRQLRDFREHGVFALVIHPRVGLPPECGWMSECLLSHMEIALREAERTGMTIYLYDEGMYPSGSAAGRVVERDPHYANRGLELVRLDEGDDWASRFSEEDDARLVGQYPLDDGGTVTVVERRSGAWIRGLHYQSEPAPGTPHSDELEVTHPAGDILNPDAVRCFIEESYEKYYERFGRWFGGTVAGVFTDEPSLLGRTSQKNLRPGTLSFLLDARESKGVDLFDELPLLWNDGCPETERYRRRYEAALDARLSEVYYRPIAEWCEAHNVALVGHPERPDVLAHLRHFQIPGQDIVLRRITPGGESGITGPESTQAKAAASVMMHEGRERNANEFCGAYGLDFTFNEMRKLAFWLLVRGCNLLMPHAFYYSVRGPRLTERPPDVGPNSAWWNRFAPFARLCAWLSQVNSEGTPLCDVGVVSGASKLPWRVPALLYENQIDFAYVGASDLDRAVLAPDGTVQIGRGAYRVLVREAGWSAELSDRIRAHCRAVEIDPDCSAEALDQVRFETCVPPLVKSADPGIRIRALQTGEEITAIVFNESREASRMKLIGSDDSPIEISPFGFMVLRNREGRSEILHEETGGLDGEPNWLETDYR